MQTFHSEKMLLMLESSRAGLNTAHAHKFICECFCSAVWLSALLSLYGKCVLMILPVSLPLYGLLMRVLLEIQSMAHLICSSVSPCTGDCDSDIHNELSAFRSLMNTALSVLQLF